MLSLPDLCPVARADLLVVSPNGRLCVEGRALSPKRQTSDCVHKSSHHYKKQHDAWFAGAAVECEASNRAPDRAPTHRAGDDGGCEAGAVPAALVDDRGAPNHVPHLLGARSKHKNAEHPTPVRERAPDRHRAVDRPSGTKQNRAQTRARATRQQPVRGAGHHELPRSIRRGGAEDARGGAPTACRRRCVKHLRAGRGGARQAGQNQPERSSPRRMSACGGGGAGAPRPCSPPRASGPRACARRASSSSPR